MRYIKRIEIKHFRSIYELDIQDISDINVFSGLNDVGKSNVIKALNLFFNDKVEWDTTLDFERDANRLHMRRSSASHNKQLISIKLTFLRPAKRYSNTLAEQFWIKRQWDRQNLNPPLMNWGMAGAEKSWSDRPRSLTEFWNRSHFYYVPAIRDQRYFRTLIHQLASSLIRGSDTMLSQVTDQVNDTVKPMVHDLLKSLQEHTAIGFDLRIPTDLRDILAAASFDTDNDIPLELRGDGIQSMGIPPILEYLSQQKKSDFYYWGYEEPENSLEARKALQLASQMRDRYADVGQLFITSHSPAFIAGNSEKTSIYHISISRPTYQTSGGEAISEPVSSSNIMMSAGEYLNENLLPDELGHYELLRRYYEELSDKLEAMDAELADQRALIKSLREPTALVEGQYDKVHLNTAWKRLYDIHAPFTVQQAGGADALTKLANAWTQINDNRMFALYDNDEAGWKAMKSLKDYELQLPNAEKMERSACTKVLDNVRASTLPNPFCPDRRAHALNKNLVIEHYYPDSVLCAIDKATGYNLYDTAKYVERKQNHVAIHNLGTRKIKALICAGEIDSRHRLFSDQGKKQLAGAVNDLKDEDFLAFHGLFRIILDHLDPDFDLKLRSELESQASQ